MKIKLLTGLVGPIVALSPGDMVDWPDGEAIRLITAGSAVPVAPAPERAVLPPANETRRKGKAR